ncbi:metallophosphoesterase family protein [Sedimentisphaera salicampi]|uniref:Phosphodiesterase n=1 Tax=Sedimentisphaera salicampi TaxID=1941349 RepID=A0A1W6LQ47_9BACT|nr:metallophosphoesterase family protein [Sedimentisphaera salicampi]ARN57871.1 phosphodiesterase [Sedimentisphaera salicampi]
MFAIISDIHSNIDALNTVLEDINKRGIKKIICLGDVLGYGPYPFECLDLIIENTDTCIMGNHDYAVLYEPTNFNYGAELAAYWTREQLCTEEDIKLAEKRWSFLAGLPMRYSFELESEGQIINVDMVHASPRRPINEYVFPDDIFTSPAKVTSLFDNVKNICFIGHTHLPGVFLEDPDFYTPDELGDYYPIEPEERAIINVGSVGQPRDRDKRASYAYVQDNKVYFVRLEYDISKISEKIYSIPMLDNFEADRLIEGR